AVGRARADLGEHRDDARVRVDEDESPLRHDRRFPQWQREDHRLAHANVRRVAGRGVVRDRALRKNAERRAEERAVRARDRLHVQHGDEDFVEGGKVLRKRRRASEEHGKNESGSHCFAYERARRNVCCSEPKSAMVAFEKAPPEARQLLTVPIRELGLSLERSPVAPFVRALYAELDAAGLHRFRPPCYLSDEWGCPSEEPVIGIPFYLGDPRVARLEDAVNDVENEREIMMYMRHEAGHAFNYAYELFRGDEWHVLFGSFRRPYRDDFPFVPFSKDYVRHIAGWYAQKHPDEDFAETFAVWLDPESNWRERYRGWGAMKKLLYVDRVAREVGERAPTHVEGETDVTVEEMEQTVEEF